MAALAACGCSAPGVQLAAPVPAPQRIRSGGEVAAPSSASVVRISSETLWVEVEDRRLERPPRALGVVRMTMGIPRQIRQTGDWDLAKAIQHGLGTGLQNAGWEVLWPEIMGQLEEGQLPSGPGEALPEPPPLWTLRLIVDRLWCDGYFNEYSFELGLRLHLLDPSGRLRERAEFRKEYVEEYAHPADFAYQVEVKTREALSTLLVDLGLARGLPPSDTRREPVGAIGFPKGSKDLEPEDYFYDKYEKSKLDEDEELDEDEDLDGACPKCEREVDPAWKHCPDCGTSLREGE